MAIRSQIEQSASAMDGGKYCNILRLLTLTFFIRKLLKSDVWYLTFAGSSGQE